MKLQKILKKFEKLYSKKVEDLSLNRIKLLMSKLGDLKIKLSVFKYVEQTAKGVLKFFIFNS